MSKESTQFCRIIESFVLIKLDSLCYHTLSLTNILKYCFLIEILQNKIVEAQRWVNNNNVQLSSTFNIFHKFKRTLFIRILLISVSKTTISEMGTMDFNDMLIQFQVYSRLVTIENLFIFKINKDKNCKIYVLVFFAIPNQNDNFTLSMTVERRSTQA